MAQATQTTFIALALLILGGCTFVEDRSQEAVSIVDAKEAHSKTADLQSPKIAQPLPQIYRVKAGDTLAKIAKKTLGHVDYYQQIADYNGINPVQPLAVGLRLAIPTKPYPLVQKVRTRTPVTNIKTKSHQTFDQLMADKAYNQAIDWAISQPQLTTDSNLQSKLIVASEAQVMQYQNSGNYSDGQLLLEGLINSGKLTGHHQTQLRQMRNKLKCEQYSLDARQLWQANKVEESYQALNTAYQANAEYAENLEAFSKTRSQVSEQMHQQALRHYRGQQLDQALSIWNKILAIKPNDDLALVYRDRVSSLQKKLQDL